jgi:cell division protein FtsL
MDLPYQLFFNISAGLGFTMAGWIIRSIYDALEKLKVDLIELEREIHAKYVEKDDYKDDVRELKSMLTALFDKLDNKADK